MYLRRSPGSTPEDAGLYFQSAPIIANDGLSWYACEIPENYSGLPTITVVTKPIINYNAGQGISIVGSTISVDTGVIQEKLYAGDGIAINGSTISVTVSGDVAAFDIPEAQFASGTGYSYYAYPDSYSDLYSTLDAL